MKKLISLAIAALICVGLSAAPTTLPAAPTADAAGVKALLSSTYDAQSAHFLPCGWGGSWEWLKIDNDSVVYHAAATWDCYTNFESDYYDCSGYAYLHLDIYSEVAGSVKITIESYENKESKLGAEVSLSEGWNAIDLEVATAYPELTLAYLKYILYEGYKDAAGESAEGNPLAFANIYFHNVKPEATSVEEIESMKAIKTIQNGQLVIIKNGVRYNALGAKL